MGTRLTRACRLRISSPVDVAVLGRGAVEAKFHDLLDLPRIEGAAEEVGTENPVSCVRLVHLGAAFPDDVEDLMTRAGFAGSGDTDLQTVEGEEVRIQTAVRCRLVDQDVVPGHVLEIPSMIVEDQDGVVVRVRHLDGSERSERNLVVVSGYLFRVEHFDEDLPR